MREVGAMRRGIGIRYATGLPLLDTHLEGGLFAGNFFEIQGPPGAGKSLLATQIALNLARLGCAVETIFSDEGNAGAFVTIGQQLGEERRLIQHNDEAATSRLYAATDEVLPYFRMANHFHRDATIEHVVDELDLYAPPGLQRVLLMDSAQTIRLASGSPRESPTEKVQRASRVMYDLVRERQIILILTSRISRGSFGKGKGKDGELTEPIAAAWGGGIEWDSDLMLHLFNKAQPNQTKVRASIEKNRLTGWSGPCPLSLEWARKRFVELDEKAEEAHAEQLVEPIKEKILDVLKGRDGVTTNELRAGVKGDGATFREARERLLRRGEIHSLRRKGRGAGELWYVGPKPASGELFVGPRGIVGAVGREPGDDSDEDGKE
jgi:hypothetical protein